jgi:hypothetical protein
MITFARALLATLCALATARAQFPAAEHLLYIRIETEPTAATLSTVPAAEGDAPVILGRTPLVIPVELNWDRSYMRKKWELLRVATRSGIATNTYDPSDKTHTVALTFALSKDGHETQIIQQIATVLEYDTSARDWDHAIKALPGKRTLTYKLTPLTTNPAPATAAPPSPVKKTTPTIIIASGSTTDLTKLGYALIETPAGTPILINGNSVGNAPLRIMLPAGPHTIGTLKDGKPAGLQTITIESGKTLPVTLDAGK